MLADMALHGGSLTREDLHGVHARETAPIRGGFHGAEIVSVGWPHGGASVLEALGILDHVSWRRLLRSDANRAHGLVEAVRIALGDRALTRVGDDHATPPDPQLDPRLWILRARQIRFDRALRDVEIWHTTRPQPSVGGTTHLVVVDRTGMIVSATLTIGNEYGAKVASPSLGFPYNDFLAGSRAGLTDDDDGPAAGTVLPTSMAPTVVLIGDHPIAALGSAGSERTIASVVEVLFNLLGTHMPLDDAVMQRRTLWCGVADHRVAIEVGEPADDAIADTLLRREFPDVFRLQPPGRPLDRAFFGGVQALARESGGTWVAVADPRRDGAASAAPSAR
jgi:gamma-glutamyltranspeptidase/glutathione hydrolase